MNYEKSCGCIIINENNKILLIHQLKGHWGLPKGHVEDNETEEQTAIREVKEETNLDVKINTNYRYTMEYSPKENVEKQVVFFVAKNITDNIIVQEEEVQGAKWLNIEDAIELITFDNSKELLRKVKKDLKL